MRFSNLTTAMGAAATLAILGNLAAPAEAFLITNTSASWDNADLSNGITVGSEGVAAPSYSTDFREEDGVSQVRWGDAVDKGYWVEDIQWIEDGYWDQETVWKSKRVKGYYYNRRGKLKYGWHDEWYETTKDVWVDTSYEVDNSYWVDTSAENKSGLGFAGVKDLSIEEGALFNLGSLQHYNNTIWANGKDAKEVDFSLSLAFADLGIGTQEFDFSLNIDETNNQASAHSGGVCPYETEPGKGCSDQITWDFAIDAESSFTHAGEDYTLELVGFSADALRNNGVVNEFISQEAGTSEASLWAKIVKVEKPTEDVPEPAALLGLSTLGLYLVKSRRDKAAAEMA